VRAEDCGKEPRRPGSFRGSVESVTWKSIHLVSWLMAGIVKKHGARIVNISYVFPVHEELHAKKRHKPEPWLT
jgi:hypothetical protein